MKELKQMHIYQVLKQSGIVPSEKNGISVIEFLGTWKYLKS